MLRPLVQQVYAQHSQEVHLTDNGIVPLKKRVVDRTYDPLTQLGSRIGRRRTT